MDKHLKAIIESDSEGIKSIYKAYQPKIVRYVVENSGNAAQGEDIFQEAIIVIFKQVREKKLQLTVPFYTYLYAVAKKLWLKKLRKNKPSIVTFPDGLEYIDDNQLDRIILEEERYRLYRAKFRLMSEQCKQLMRLFLKKTSMKEIVEKMSFSSISYAKKRKFQCKESLIKLIHEDDQYNVLR